MDSILIVEDDRKISAMVGEYLSAVGFTCRFCHDGLSALKEVKNEEPALVLLDLMLPGLDGFDFIRQLRSFSSVPVIMMTARAEEHDKLMGLELGADDYITKPFSLKEVAARIRAVLRRTGASYDQTKTISCYDLTIDTKGRTIYRLQKIIPLTALQFDLFCAFLKRRGQVFRRHDLLDMLQDGGVEGYERTIDVHIKNIRKALGKNPEGGEYIQTVWGVGYKIPEESV